MRLSAVALAWAQEDGCFTFYVWRQQFVFVSYLNVSSYHIGKIWRESFRVLSHISQLPHCNRLVQCYRSWM